MGPVLSPAASLKRLPALLSALDRLNERERCENSLIEFFACAWPQFDPAPVKINWHHEVIAEHLEAVTRGEIRKLLISVPPRCSKTSLVNVCWPAWIWAQPEIGPLSGPRVRFMCLSYGQTLSIDIATTARRLVMGPWYQRHWGRRVILLEDQASKEILPRPLAVVNGSSGTAARPGSEHHPGRTVRHDGNPRASRTCRPHDRCVHFLRR
jgi:hypothetical protein